MYYSRLLILNKMLEQEQIKKLDNYFTKLVGDESKNITVSKIVSKIDVSVGVATKILLECKHNGLLIQRYVLKCPECGMSIKGYEIIDDIPEEAECYNCEENIEVTAENITVVYSLVEDSGSDNSVFKLGQQLNKTKPCTVALEDTLKGLIDNGGLNNYLFELSNEQYNLLNNMYVEVKNNDNSTAKKGTTLEKFTLELFNLCKIFIAKGINTATNQIDCAVRNKLNIGIGILEILGSLFIVECKNENKTPSGTYMNKIHSIITNFNAGDNHIKFGIIVSKKKPPSTFKKLSRDYYLNHKIIIISICGDEIEEMLKNKGNLIELIERKYHEIIMNATTDLKKANLYFS